MRIFKDFKCKKHSTVFDRLVTNDVNLVECECGAEAVRVISAPKFLGNSTGGNASFKQKRV